MITEEKFKQEAERLNVEVAAIKAVAEIESSGSGFLQTGEPKILFEPHVFWRELVKRGVDPTKHTVGNEDILYQVWGTKPYGRVSEQHARLQRATLINREAALSSASWGKFQILGLHWSSCSCASLQDFINKIYTDDDAHLELFSDFILNSNLTDELRTHAWKEFARKYNGPGYARNNYDTRLQQAYERFSK